MDGKVAKLIFVTARHQPPSEAGRIKAVLGPTNTGKTHLAVERLCAHSSGAIGFPLRLLAREVYDRVVKIKGENQVALITGEERIEPPQARWLLCTAEAMPVGRPEKRGDDLAFVALDEAQLAADRERGHIFTDRLLHARGREETMIMGSATMAPIVRTLIPGAELTDRPRFSTLAHAGTCKLSRLPPRSAIVAFSAEQVYAVAEMLRRFRGGAAVVMGALSPQTRNAQVALFQSREVDYIVATDAIGMGLNLDVTHVAFAGLSKYDGIRQRRLTTAEMAQIAGRAGRHQQDGSFGTLSGVKGSPAAFTEEEIHAIEEHRFPPLSRLYWRNGNPRCDSLDTLIADLEARPDDPCLAPAPEAIDLAVLKRLADDPQIAADIMGSAQVVRFWDVCSLPDFRQHGAEPHARFVTRLWQDLRDGALAADYVAGRIAELDNPDGDIDTLQGRIAAIRSWAYIAQRPDWVIERQEMAERARAAEARLSDALHTRLTERFVNRRTAVLMKTVGKDAGLLRVALGGDGAVSVEGEQIGHLEGFRFVVDSRAGHADRKLLLAAAEKHLPQLLAQKAEAMIASELGELTLENRAIQCNGQEIARLLPGRLHSRPRLELTRELAPLAPARHEKLAQALEHWLAGQLEPLDALRKLEEAARDPASGTELRALLHALIEGNGGVIREKAGLAHLSPDRRRALRSLGVIIGALDIFVPALLKPAPRRLLRAIGADRRPVAAEMEPVLSSAKTLPSGYRRAGKQAIRIDMAEKLLRAAHAAREAAPGKNFPLDTALATSMGLGRNGFAQLLHDAGFRSRAPRSLPDDAHGPPAPQLWSWRPPRKDMARRRSGEKHKPREGSAFAALAELVR